MERIARSPSTTAEDLGSIIDLVGWEDLELDVNGRGVQCDLADIRGRFKMVVEATIWARLHGFDSRKNTPKRLQNEAKFMGVRDELTNYWRKRFASNIDVWLETQRRIRKKFADLDDVSQVFYLQQYFWAIVEDLPQLRPNELTQLSQ